MTELVPDESPVGDSDGNGAIERANLAIGGQVRVLMDCFELKLGAAIHLESATMKWLARHDAWALTTYQKGSDCMTAHQRIRGNILNVQVAAFGEAVLFKPHKDGGRLRKAAPRWRDGIWLGFNSRTHEHIVSDEGEVVHCRTIHRRPPENMWNKQLVLDIKGTPWNRKGGEAVMDHEVTLGRGSIAMENQRSERRRQYRERRRGRSASASTSPRTRWASMEQRTVSEDA